MNPNIAEESSESDTFTRLETGDLVSVQPNEQRRLVDPRRNELVAETSSQGDMFWSRLQSFSKWRSKKSSLQLATAGFIYTGITDKVECQSCGIRLYDWQEDDDPLQAHKKYAPDCEFMLKNFPNVQAPPKPKKILTVKYPDYSHYETRLRSFDKWPLKCVAQKPEMMARSGFFYVGSADRVRCFHCGVTLREWDTDDYPPCAHRQWSKNCPFVQELDVERMKKEIEEWERQEQLTEAFRNTQFFESRSVPNDEQRMNLPFPTPPEENFQPRPRHQRQLRRIQRRVQVEHTLRLPPRGFAEFTIRGDNGEPGSIWRIEDSTRSAE